jgi:TonB family protein
VSGRLPPEIIQRIVAQNRPAFRRCYEDGLTRNPNLSGKVVVTFVIGTDGNVTSASDGGSTMPDPAVTQCILKRAKTMSFPAPEGGIVTVTIPLMFSSS